MEQTGKTIPKSMQTMGGPILDVCWSDVSSHFFFTISSQIIFHVFIFQDFENVIFTLVNRVLKIKVAFK